MPENLSICIEQARSRWGCIKNALWKLGGASCTPKDTSSCPNICLSNNICIRYIMSVCVYVCVSVVCVINYTTQIFNYSTQKFGVSGKAL